MTKEERDVQRKLKVLRHAEKTGHVARTCRYFGVGRSSFYRWRAAYEQRGEAGLINQKAHSTESCQPDATRDRREGSLPAQQIPPRVDQDRLVSGALSRHQNLR
jgi:transposase-like protein